MGTHIQFHKAKPGSFSYIAGEHLYKNGPQTERDLLAAVDSKLRPHEQDEALQRSLRGGWLSVAPDGRIVCSAGARDFYDELAGIVKVKEVGQIAAPRQAFNAFERPPLRKAYMPNSRGIRQDVPAWSVRPVGFGFKNIGGGGA